MPELNEAAQERKSTNESMVRINKRRAIELRLADAIARDDRSEVDGEIAVGGFSEADDRIILFELVWLLGKEKRQLLGFDLRSGAWFDRLNKYLVETGLRAVAQQKTRDYYANKAESALHLSGLASLLSCLFDLRKEAEGLYHKAIAIDDESLESVIAMNRYGVALNDWGRHSEAEAVILRALDFSPDSIGMFHN